jgi:capsule polysaccharide export protein KpsE/RkpR
MSSNLKRLEEIVNQLPPASQAEVIRFASSLLEKRKKKSDRKLNQTWAGGLSDFKDQYTSLELQKKAMDWMIASALEGTSVSIDDLIKEDVSTRR